MLLCSPGLFFSIALLFILVALSYLCQFVTKRGRENSQVCKYNLRGSGTQVYKYKLRGRSYLHSLCNLVGNLNLSVCFILTRKKISMISFVFVSVVLLQENPLKHKRRNFHTSLDSFLFLDLYFFCKRSWTMSMVVLWVVLNISCKDV